MTVVVLDTNAIVSAPVFRGQPYAALEQALLPPFVIAVSAEIRDELVGTLTERFGWELERTEAEATRTCSHCTRSRGSPW